MKHFILFSGHMIDAEDRLEPRFPIYKEGLVKEELFKCLSELKNAIHEEMQGIAGGACGGDILFHESCARLNIPTEIYLALPIEEFKKNSVSFAGPDWEMRLDKLTEKIPLHILPKPLIKNDETVWESTNRWMLETVTGNYIQNITLIALWDGKKGDGKGGTQHMVEVTKKLGGEVIIIDIEKL